ncbi:MAG: single-stranded DNA-binding protein [Selenomonadaceae bacterium]|nr:single-stranded DNA-binding protein [Selenomonadaceae bacterium]
MNKVILSGNLTRAPELRYSINGLAVAKFGIAVKRPLSKNDDADFFHVVVVGKLAEFCGRYFSKGKRAFIEGRLQSSTYTDKSGVKHYSVDVIAENIEFGDSKKNPSDTPQNKTVSEAAASVPDYYDEPPNTYVESDNYGGADEEDDISLPF